MKEVLILKCSPRAGGVSDALADFFRAGAGDFACREIALREKRIVPCQNCGACAPFPHCCPLDALDDCREIFDALEDAPLALFAAPIYFYALPAHFKAFIDRGQRFWQARQTRIRKAPVLALMAGGRPRGEKLFEGAIRTMRWFLKGMDADLDDSLCFRGLDNIGDLRARPEIAAEVAAWAQKWLAAAKTC